MADLDRTIDITLQLDDNGAVAGIRSVNGATQQLDKEGSAAGRSFGTTMQFALGELAATAAMELAHQFTQVIQQGARLVGMSADIAETQSKFNTVFGNSARVVERFIQQNAQMMGLTRSQAQELLATSGAIAQGAGLAVDQSAQMSVRIGELAGDIASFNNAEPQRVFEAITSALTGEREQLKQFGIVLRESAVQQRALAQTGLESADALTRQQKALATVSLIAERAGPAIGDLARTSDSAANQSRAANAGFRQMVETFSAELLPVAVEVNEELLKLANNDEVTAMVRSTAQAVSDMLVDGIQTFSEVVSIVHEYSDVANIGAQATAHIAATVGGYVAAVKLQTLWTNRSIIATKAATIAQRGWNAAMKANPVGLIVGALTLVLPLIWRFRDQITDAAAAVLDFGAKTIRGLQGVIQWFQRLVDSVPMAMNSMIPGLGLFRKAVENADEAVDASANKMEEWADGLRSAGEESEKLTLDAQAETVAFDENTNAVERNTDALRDNADARDDAGGGTVSAPDVENVSGLGPETIDVETQANVQGLSGFGSAIVQGKDAIDAALENLRGSGDRLSEALRRVNQELEKTSNPQKRSHLLNIRDRLKQAKSAADALQRGMDNISRATKQAAVDSFVALGQAIGNAENMFASFGQAARAILSDLAQQIGKQLIAMGTAQLLANPAKGAAMIAAGTGLVAFGAATAGGRGGASGGRARSRQPAQPPRMARGGSVRQGEAVIVGDAPGGRLTPYSELFVPEQAGTIVPRSGFSMMRGIGGESVRSGTSEQAMLRKLDDVQTAFERKQFGIRGRDLQTSQARTETIQNDAGIK